MKRTFAQITQDTLNHLVELSRWLVEWGLWERNRERVRNEVAKIADGVRHLTKIADHYRDAANREYELRDAEVIAISHQIGEVYENERQLTVSIDELCAQLAGLKTRREHHEADIAAARRSIHATRTKLNDRLAKLEELRDWFWVPGYGQYLAAKTLVDKDAVAAKTLAESLAALETQIANDSASTGQILQAELQMKELKSGQEVQRTARESFRNDLHARRGRLKQTIVFLTQVAGFWGQIKIVAADDVGFSVDMLKEAEDRLNETLTIPAMEDSYLRGLAIINSSGYQITVTLRQAVARLAEAMDSNADGPTKIPSSWDDGAREFIVRACGNLWRIDWDTCLSRLEYSGGTGFSVFGDRVYLAGAGNWPLGELSRHGEFIQGFRFNDARSSLFRFVILPDKTVAQFHCGELVFWDLQGNKRGESLWYCPVNADDWNGKYMQYEETVVKAIVIDDQLVYSQNGHNQIGAVDLKTRSRPRLFRDLRSLGQPVGAIASCRGKLFVVAGPDLYAFPLSEKAASSLVKIGSFSITGRTIQDLASADDESLFVLAGQSIYEVDPDSGKTVRTVADNLEYATEIALLP